jgi:hypothetical protein
MLGAGLGIFALGIIAGAVGLLFVLVAALGLVVLIVVGGVGVFTQLIAIAQIIYDLAGKTGKGLLIGKCILQVFKGAAGLFFDKTAPQVHHVIRAGRQIAPRRQMPD